MGLAASQARFLGITMRKANCEFRSTELAQQRVELSQQLSEISIDYANSINPTKLTWVNEACESDYALTYGILMNPSTANDYNPYFVTTKSGAIVLDNKFSEAAKAAGISMAGGIPNETGYKNFITELGNQNIITKTTQDTLLQDTLKWHPSSGLGAIPKDKRDMTDTTLAGLIDNPDIGGATLDWLQIYRAALGYEFGEKQTDYYYTEIIKDFDTEIDKLKNNYSSYLKGKEGSSNSANDVKTAAEKQVETWPPTTGIMKQFYDLEQKIESGVNGESQQALNELEPLIKGLKPNGTYANKALGLGDITINDEECKYAYPMFWEIYQKAKYNYYATDSSQGNGTLKWATTDNEEGTISGDSIWFGRVFSTTGGKDNVKADNIAGGGSHGYKSYKVENSKRTDITGKAMSTLTMFVNGNYEKDETNIKSMTLADLLLDDVVIMTQVKPTDAGGNGDITSSNLEKDTAVKTLEIVGEGMMEYIASLFGLGNIGTGLNVDSSTNEALENALKMVKKNFLDASKAEKHGSKADDNNPLDNDAYINSFNYNAIGVEQSNKVLPLGDETFPMETYAALNLSNMVSAFLTYFDNYLRGAESEYHVGRTNDEERTYFVTDDPGYVYISNVQNNYTVEEKISDFYNQLYNNLCEHGWRLDDHLEDYRYLENSIKNGKYSLMSLSPDGYYYQNIYNNIGYIKEEIDQDKVAQAEAEFTRKKAEITSKEDNIDIKTKKLDAEIAELNAELTSVQNIISKSIEKTFTMFSN